MRNDSTLQNIMHYDDENQSEVYKYQTVSQDLFFGFFKSLTNSQWRHSGSI